MTCEHTVLHVVPLRMPAYQTDTPVLVLDCDHDFETDQEQADLHLKKVAEFISKL